MTSPPTEKGVLINRFPKREYNQVFECVTINCKFTLNFQIPIQIPPGALFLFKISDWVWECPNCGVLQTTEQDLPRSRPLTQMELVGQGGANGENKIIPVKKRKRKPKKKEKDNGESENIIE